MFLAPEAGKLWFTIAVGMIMLTVGLLFVVEPGTAAYYINLFSLITGLILLGLVIVLVRRSNK